MGPRLITCGADECGIDCIKIWGTAEYVAQEYEKAQLLSTAQQKPPFYNSLM
jgi:hypothetical protein